MYQEGAAPSYQEDEAMGAAGEHTGSGDWSEKSNLIVNYIPQFATEEDLALIFNPIGRVENIKIMRDYKTGYSYGFGFVKYFSEEDAAKAIHIVNGMNYKHKRLKVSYSRPSGTAMKDSNLYITNLPKDVTEQDVQSLFCEFGEIVQKSVLKDKITGMPRGVAFVRFSRGEEAQAAIAGLDGKLLDNAMFPLSVRVAEDHGRQKAQYFDNWTPPNRGFVPPFRGAPLPGKWTRPYVPNRGARFPNVRHMGAGDNCFQNQFYC